MIDMTLETPITLEEAAKVYPPARNGRPRHVSYLIRGITRGINGIRLEAGRDGARWLTTREALQPGWSADSGRPRRRIAREPSIEPPWRRAADAELIAAGF